MSDNVVVGSGPVYSPLLGQSIKSAVPLLVQHDGAFSDWLRRADFLSVRTSYNSCLRGGGDAEGPWKPALRKLFD